MMALGIVIGFVLGIVATSMSIGNKVHENDTYIEKLKSSLTKASDETNKYKNINRELGNQMTILETENKELKKENRKLKKQVKENE